MMSGASVEAVCRVCSADSVAELEATDVNRRLSDETFHYARCAGCGLWFLADLPADPEIYYDDEYHDFPDQDQLARVVARESYQIGHLLQVIEPYGRLVEVGGAWGVFSTQARDAGFDVHVIEMDARCCSYLQDVVDVAATCSGRPEEVLVDMPASRAIVLWQVLEHLPEPVAFLDAVAGNLQPGGVLLLATPNPDSLGFRLFGSRWPHLDAPRHLTLIPSDLLKRLSSERGLEELFTVDNDLGARRWNRFAWQRLLLNRCRSRWLHIPLLVIGALVSAAMSPWETRPGNGSSYTAAYRKVVT